MSATFRSPAAPRCGRELLAALLLTGLFLGTFSSARGQGTAPGPETRIPAIELDGVGWLGTDKPIRLKDLRGKIVILDFWTLC